MSLLFEYKPGMSLVDPWVFTTTRAQAAYFIDSTGKLVQVGANVLRDRHYPFGLGSAIRTTLMEPNSTNFLLQSQALNTSPWVPSLLTVTNNSAAAPDGTTTASKLVPTAVNSASHADNAGTITTTANEALAYSCYIKATGYTGAVLTLTDGVSKNIAIAIDLAAGTVTNISNGGTFAGSLIVPLANGWFWVGVWGVVTNLTSVLPIVYCFDTGAHAIAGTAFTGDTTSGIYAWGAQVERFGAGAGAVSPPTSYMPTTSGTASRTADLVTIPMPFPTIPMWCYTKMVDLGGSVRGAGVGTGGIEIVASGLTDPQWVAHFHRNNSAPGSSWISGCGPGGAGGTNQNTVASSVFPVPYDTVETFSRVMKDGATNFAVRNNGGAVSVSGQVGPTAGIPFVAINTPTVLRVGAVIGGLGLLDGVLVIRLGADPTRITTLDQAAAA